MSSRISPVVKAAALLWCLVLVASLAWPEPAVSQFHEDVPTHSHPSPGEQGWACDEGFRQMAQLCVWDSHGAAEQGAFEVFNGQWRCRSGYREEKGFCVPSTAPEHASFVGNGQWECDWGFQKVGSRCKEISPPEHAYLDASGRDWVCYPGYERESDRCVTARDAAPAGSDEAKP
jgi:hypothetical protein